MTRGLDLFVGRVVAAAASLIGIPADLCACRGLCLVIFNVVAKSLCKYRTADGTRLRGRARCSRTGRMTRGLDLFVGCVVATAARLIGIPADLRAGWCLCIVLLEVMPECRNCRRVRITALGTCILPSASRSTCRLRSHAGRCCMLISRRCSRGFIDNFAATRTCVPCVGAIYTGTTDRLRLPIMPKRFDLCICRVITA